MEAFICAPPQFIEPDAHPGDEQVCISWRLGMWGRYVVPLSRAVLGDGQCVLATTRLKRHAVCRRAPPPHARAAWKQPCS
eukprot:COSAG02_NODE_53274_length_303_cov_0.333333_1_plen_79_part_01